MPGTSHFARCCMSIQYFKSSQNIYSAYYPHFTSEESCSEVNLPEVLNQYVVELQLEPRPVSLEAHTFSCVITCFLHEERGQDTV